MGNIAAYMIISYLIIINIIGLTLMGIDKKRARRSEWRIPERRLLLIAFLGGGAGSFLGMHMFRHKTKHPKFTALIPLAMILELMAAVKLMAVLMRS